MRGAVGVLGIVGGAVASLRRSAADETGALSHGRPSPLRPPGHAVDTGLRRSICCTNFVLSPSGGPVSPCGGSGPAPCTHHRGCLSWGGGSRPWLLPQKRLSATRREPEQAGPSAVGAGPRTVLAPSCAFAPHFPSLTRTCSGSLTRKGPSAPYGAKGLSSVQNLHPPSRVRSCGSDDRRRSPRDVGSAPTW